MVTRYLTWLTLLVPLGSLAGEAPPWTERSSWIETPYLMTVGTATNVTSRAEGRILAFENGRREIENFYAGQPLEPLPEIETQMTFEEVNADGTFNVYRLLRVRKDQVRVRRKNPEPELSPWAVSWGASLTTPTSKTGVTTYSLLNLSVERRFLNHFGLRLGLSFSNGFVQKGSEVGTPGSTDTITTDLKQFELSGATPVYLVGGLNLYPELGLSISTTNRSVRRFNLLGYAQEDTSYQSVDLQPFFGTGLGYSDSFTKGGRWGGYVRGGVRLYVTPGDKPTPAFHGSAGLQVTF